MFKWLTKNKNSKRLPHWLDDYLSLDFKIDGQLAVNEAEYVVLDCETTGLDKSDEVITIGAVTCTIRDIYLDRILDQHYACMQVGESSEIHGELSSNDGVDLNEGLEELVSYVSNKIIVGHNISFDIFKINQLLTERFGVKLKNKVLDTADLVKRLDPVQFDRIVGGTSKLHLDDLCDSYNIPIENRHTALGDAYLTAQLLQKILLRLEKRGLTRARQLLSK